MGIPGCLITIGAGLHFITVAGAMMIIMDGNGFPVTNGRLPGFAGVTVAVIMVGRH